MMDVIFYKFNGRYNEVNKTLGEGVTLSGWLRNDFNMFQPSLNVRNKDVLQYNYCYILGKYYFVDSTITSTDTYELQLTEDVLMTYKDNILQSYGVLTKRANADKYISTRDNIYNVKPQKIKLSFANSGLFNEDGSIIMITIKGKSK